LPKEKPKGYTTVPKPTISNTDRITLRVLAAFGIAVLIANGVDDLGPRVRKAVCSWEWVASERIKMCPEWPADVASPEQISPGK
jgi:hypothetical protein